jgi:hypothetical protein
MNPDGVESLNIVGHVIETAMVSPVIGQAVTWGSAEDAGKYARTFIANQHKSIISLQHGNYCVVSSL